MNYKYSIIIPVYNVEKYLLSCVNSVLEQSYINYEIILVDDGSPDSCPRICDELGEKDSRIKVIHKVNGGLSDARNKGVQAAAGDYVMFLDSDDFWDDKDALLKINQRMNQTHVDVLNYGYKKTDENGENKVDYFKKNLDMPIEYTTKKEQVDFLSRHGFFIASACNKVIKRELFDEKLMFEVGVMSEDIEWCVRLLEQARSFDHIQLSFYCYRQVNSSISHGIKKKNCDDVTNHILTCIHKLDTASDDIRDTLASYCAFQYGTFFAIQTRAESVPTECINKLKDYTWILRYHNGNKKLMILYALCKLIGYKNTCALLRLVLKK